MTPSGKMSQRRGERLEAGSLQECHGRYGREGGGVERWHDLGTVACLQTSRQKLGIFISVSIHSQLKPQSKMWILKIFNKYAIHTFCTLNDVSRPG